MTVEESSNNLEITLQYILIRFKKIPHFIEGIKQENSNRISNKSGFYIQVSIIKIYLTFSRFYTEKKPLFSMWTFYYLEEKGIYFL